jgi:hypothetical protein
MAGKLEPEDAFRLLGTRMLRHRAVAPGAKVATIGAEESFEADSSEPRVWFRRTLILLAMLAASGFVLSVIFGAYLLLKEQPQPAIGDVPLTVFSEEQTREQITSTLRDFLECANTEDRLRHVVNPDLERSSLTDYYERRGNIDVGLWRIQFIEHVQLEAVPIWMVAYQDVERKTRYSLFQRVGSDMRIQWSPSYSYGALDWSELARTQPDGPVQMRAYLLRHDGHLPPGVEGGSQRSYVIENADGFFSALAIMNSAAEGAALLDKIPSKARVPVNLELGYTKSPYGGRQLVIHRLIHFQWQNRPLNDKGKPVELQH